MISVQLSDFSGLFVSIDETSGWSSVISSLFESWPSKRDDGYIVYFCFHAFFSAFGKSRDIKLSRSLNMILFLFADQITCLGGGFL